jgi:hypothetical protein
MNQGHTLSPREVNPGDHGNRSINGDIFGNMEKEPIGILGWIVNIISVTGAIAGILGIFVILLDLMGL